jgi:hypothetical protein
MNDDQGFKLGWKGWAIIVGLGVLMLWVGFCGCYTKSISYQHPKEIVVGREADGSPQSALLIYEERWSQTTLLKPDGWPSGLLKDK